MSKVLKVAIPLTAILLIGIAFLGWRQLGSVQTIQGSLCASFAGKTNETGEILVLLTNGSRWQITYYPRIEIMQSGLWPALPSNTAFEDIAKPRIIQPFTNEPVALAPPVDAAKWRLLIVYVAATERNRRVQRTQNLLERIGFPSIGYRIEWDHPGFLFLPETKDPFDRTSN